MTAGEAGLTSPPRGDGRRGITSPSWRVLRDYPDFRRLFTSTSISLLGSSVTAVALPLTAVSYLHASPAQMGLLGALSLLPHLILGLPAGVWVDRMPYRRTLILADFARAPLLASVPLLAALDLLQVWHLYVVAVLAGTGSLFESVTAQSFTPTVVPRKELLIANSSLMMVNATVNTTGSALGGLLASLLTAPVALAADAISFVLSGWSKARIRSAGTTAVAGSGKRRTLAEIIEGLRAVFGHPIIRAVMLAATIGALAGRMQDVLIVLYLVRTLQFSPTLIGVVIAVAGAAGILSATVAARVTRRLGHGWAFITGMLLASGAGLVLAAANGPLVLAVAVVVVAQVMRGAGPSLYGVNQQTLRQALITPALLARANATWRFLVYGMQALGAALGGLVGSVMSLRGTLVFSSVLMLVGTAVAVASPLRSSRELPEPERFPPPLKTGR